jgi:RNA polymerase sigma factor (sigma-70 family)
MDITDCENSADWRRLESLYSEHADWLRAMLKRRLRVQSAEVEDIIQDIWLRLATRNSSAAIRYPKAFLAQTALNLFRNGRRNDMVRQNYRSAVIAHDVQQVCQKPEMSEQEASLELEQLILDIPETYRDVFVLSRFRQMTNARIAGHLGISIKTVEWRMGKALEFCMKRLLG